MSNEVAKVEARDISAPVNFTQDQIELIKNSFCKGLSDDEFKIFLYTCQRTGLDPFARQIYAVKRFDAKLQREVMTIQTGIDGYRLLADRTGTYAPGPEATFSYDDKGRLFSATSHVKKLTKDGTWHTVSATAYYDEYVQTTKDGRPMGLWGKMPRTMLSKCSEALALRKACPADLSGIYTKEELEQEEIEVAPLPIVKTITKEEAQELEFLISECDPQKQEKMWAFLEKNCGSRDLAKLNRDCYSRVKTIVLERRAEYKAKQITEQPRSMDELVEATNE